MKECCQCGHTAEVGFVTFCDECYDNDQEVEDNSNSKENQKNKELIEVIDSFIRQDHNKGYPTGTEWRNLITEAKKLLSKYPNN